MSPMLSLTLPLTWSALPPHSVERSPTTLPVSSLILPFAWSHLPSVLSFIAHAPSKLRHTAGKTGAVTLSSYDDDRRDGARRPEHAIAARLSRASVRGHRSRVARRGRKCGEPSDGTRDRGRVAPVGEHVQGREPRASHHRGRARSDRRSRSASWRGLTAHSTSG